MLLGRDSLSQVIQILTKECTTVGANFEDDEGIFALEYAIESRTKLGSIQYTQEHPFKCGKKKKQWNLLKEKLSIEKNL